MFCGPQGLKSSLAKAAGAQPSGGMRDQELHAAKTQSKLEVKKLKASHVWVIFSGRWDVEKVHVTAARSKFQTQNGTRRRMARERRGA